MHPKEYAELERNSGGEPFGALLIPARRAFASIGCGTTKGYSLIADGTLVARKLGTRTMIEAESLRAYAASLPRVPTRAA
jgi:hypothetical protein